jgi:hypothetical protein
MGATECSVPPPTECSEPPPATSTQIPVNNGLFGQQEQFSKDANCACHSFFWRNVKERDGLGGTRPSGRWENYVWEWTMGFTKCVTELWAFVDKVMKLLVARLSDICWTFKVLGYHCGADKSSTCRWRDAVCTGTYGGFGEAWCLHLQGSVIRRLFDTKDGGSMHLRNVLKYVPVETASHSRSLKFPFLHQIGVQHCSVEFVLNVRIGFIWVRIGKSWLWNRRRETVGLIKCWVAWAAEQISAYRESLCCVVDVFTHGVFCTQAISSFHRYLTPPHPSRLCTVPTPYCERCQSVSDKPNTYWSALLCLPHSAMLVQC